MKSELKIAFFVLGFTSVVAQILIIRELAASFYSNEFFTGWVLFSWLLWTSLGSSWGSERPRQAASAPAALACALFLTALLSVCGVGLVRFGRLFLAQAPGVLPDLFPALVYSFMAVGPLCFLLGWQFVLATRIASGGGNAGESARLMGSAYFLESIGFVAGGVTFFFFLIRMESFGAASLIFWLNGVAGCWLLVSERKLTLRLLVAIISLLAALLVLNSGRLETLTANWRFPSEQLVMTRNTLKGNIAVTRLGSQYNFYENGLLLGADRESMAAEYLVHFPMLAHSHPRKVLFLGTGLNGPLKEVLKHDPDQVTAVDMDPEFSRIAVPFLPPDLKKDLFDRRVHFWNGDSRDFFMRSQEHFDVIIANFPDPLSMMIDRYYTKEFFENVRRHLNPGGVFSTRLGFSANSIAPEMERLGSSVYATLGDVFRTVKVLPEDTAYFLAAAAENDAFEDSAVIAHRVRERKLAVDFATPDYVRYRFTNDRVAQVETVFMNSIWKLKNLDLKPQSYYFAFVRWLSQFHSGVSKVFLRLAEIPFAAVVASLLLLIAWPVFIAGSPEGNVRRLSLTAMRTAGFTVMAFEIVLIYLFQVAWGDLYYRIAALITALMAGIGAGAWVMTCNRIRSTPWALAVLHALAVLFYTGLTVVLLYGTAKNLFFHRGWEFFFYAAAVLGGLLAGSEFPLVNGLYLTAGKGEHSGAVYAADLAGSCLGALLTATFLLPVWGVKKTLILLAGMNLLLLPFLLFRKNLCRKDL